LNEQIKNDIVVEKNLSDIINTAELVKLVPKPIKKHKSVKIVKSYAKSAEDQNNCLIVGFGTDGDSQ
jgi:hypothetical protein